MIPKTPINKLLERATLRCFNKHGTQPVELERAFATMLERYRRRHLIDNFALIEAPRLDGTYGLTGAAIVTSEGVPPITLKFENILIKSD